MGSNDKTPCLMEKQNGKILVMTEEEVEMMDVSTKKYKYIMNDILQLICLRKIYDTKNAEIGFEKRK